MTSNTLFLLDLDHTLIYGSYAPSETADLLFHYSQYLKVYERPYARELVQILQEKGDIIVFTTAKEDYAQSICHSLAINEKALLSRDHCQSKGDRYLKNLRKEWAEIYSRICIIDDSPQVWNTYEYDIEWFVPKEFRGEKEDTELLPILEKLKAW